MSTHSRGYNKFFPHFLVTEHHANGRDLQVIRPFAFDDPVEGLIQDDPNEVTDMASTPRPIWWLVPPFGRYLFGAVIHDHLYRTLMLGLGFRAWRRSDRVLYRAMKLAPHYVSAFDRVTIYLGLLLGGWICYLRLFSSQTKKKWGKSTTPRVGVSLP